MVASISNLQRRRRISRTGIVFIIINFGSGFITATVDRINIIAAVAITALAGLFIIIIGLFIIIRIVNFSTCNKSFTIT